MKHYFTLGEQEFSIESEGKVFLEKYVTRIREYISGHDLEIDLEDDLIQRLSEKLSAIQSNKDIISNKDCIKVVNQLGEPEDIFGDEQDKKGPSYYLFKDPDHGIILGVCKGISNKFHLSVRILRILFIGFAIFYTIGIWVYLLLGIILPNKNKKLSFIERTCDVISRLFHKFRYLLKNITMTFIPIIKSIFLYTLYLFIFFCGLLALLGFLVLAGMFIGKFTIDHQEIFGLFPWYANLVRVFGVIGCIIIIIAIVQQVFKKPIISTKTIVGGMITILFSGLFMFATISALSKDFSGSVSKNQTISIPAITSGDIDLYALENENINIRINETNSVKVLPNTSEDFIKIDIETFFHTSDKVVAQKSIDAISPILYTMKGEKITIYPKGNSYFTNIVPFTAPSRQITIWLPTTFRGRILSNGHTLENVGASDTMKQYNGYDSCFNSPLFFNSQNQQFFCEDSKKIDYARRHFFENQITESLISEYPLLHEPQSLSETGINISISNYHREIKKIDWINANKLNITFSDDLVDVFAEVSIDECKGKIKKTNRTIHKIENISYYDTKAILPYYRLPGTGDIKALFIN